MVPDLRDALDEIDRLKDLFDQHLTDDYFVAAKRFLDVWRDPIREAALYPEPFFRTIRCLQALLVIHDITATVDVDVRCADEDVYLDATARFRPRPSQRNKHKFELETRRGNIFKRRAFDAVRQAKLEEASLLFREAVQASEEALRIATQVPADTIGAERSLQYLRFHCAVSEMRHGTIGSISGVSGLTEAPFSDPA